MLNMVSIASPPPPIYMGFLYYIIPCWWYIPPSPYFPLEYLVPVVRDLLQLAGQTLASRSPAITVLTGMVTERHL